MSKALTGTGWGAAAVTLVLGTLVTACGSSGSAASGASGTAGSATGSMSSPASASSPAAPSSSASAVTIDISGNFCKDARSEASHSSQLQDELTTTDPAQLKALEQTYAGVLTRFAAEAPSQIKASVEVLVNGDRTLLTALAAADYDYTKLSPTAIAPLETPAFTAAAAQVTAYLRTTCHIATPG